MKQFTLLSVAFVVALMLITSVTSARVQPVEDDNDFTDPIVDAEPVELDEASPPQLHDNKNILRQGDTLYPGQYLQAGAYRTEFFYTYYRFFRLYHQTDGNLVLYKYINYYPTPPYLGLPLDTSHYEVLWASNTYGMGTTRLSMQRDGNLVIYSGSTPVWNSETWHKGKSAILQPDGNFVIYDPSGQPVWSTDTWQGSEVGNFE